MHSNAIFLQQDCSEDVFRSAFIGGPHRRKPRRPLRVKPHAGRTAPGHEPVAIVFDLVQPAGIAGRLVRVGKAGLDKFVRNSIRPGS